MPDSLTASYASNGTQTSARPLTDLEWETLMERIRDGVCTPFLGAGVNLPNLPLGGEIAKRWAAEHDYPLADATNLASVAQYLALTGPERPYPKEQIAKLLKEPPLPVFAPTHPLAVLADLPLPVYLTTNYDDYMFHALRQNHRHAKVELCAWNPSLRGRSSVLYEEVSPQNSATTRAHYNGFGPSCFSVRGFNPTPASPVVFHMHGHQSMTDSMVLTENDYLDFLVNMSRDQKLLPARIKESLTGASLLFLGYSLDDYNFRVLFRGLLHPLAETRKLSVSIQLKREDRKALTYLDKYFDEFKIRVFWGTADEFVEELSARWNKFKSRG